MSAYHYLASAALVVGVLLGLLLPADFGQTGAGVAYVFAGILILNMVIAFYRDTRRYHRHRNSAYYTPSGNHIPSHNSRRWLCQVMGCDNIAHHTCPDCSMNICGPHYQGAHSACPRCYNHHMAYVVYN